MHPECASTFYWRMCLDTTWLLFRAECRPLLSFHSFPVKREQLLWWPCYSFVKCFFILISNFECALRFTSGYGKQREESFKDKAQVETCALAWCGSCRARGFDVVWGVCLSQMPWKSWKLRRNTPGKLAVGAVSPLSVEFPSQADLSIGILRPYSFPPAGESLKDLHQERVGGGGGGGLVGRRTDERLSKPHIFFVKNLWSLAIYLLPLPPSFTPTLPSGNKEEQSG